MRPRPGPAPFIISPWLWTSTGFGDAQTARGYVSLSTSRHCLNSLHSTRPMLRRVICWSPRREAGKLVCPMSPGANDETLGAPEVWRAISDLHEELSMDIDFLDPKVIRQRETFTAAAIFRHQPPLYALAEEAFDRDPHIERDELFAGGVRVIARFGPNDLQSAEVAREKASQEGGFAARLR